MTFQQLADQLGIDLLDLIPDGEEVERIKDQELYPCQFLEDLCSDGVLEYSQELGDYQVVSC